MRIDKGHRKNHYVPVWYLKHFTNKEGLIYVFDKQARYRSKEILQKTPNQICYEYNRYLMKFPKGEEITVLETNTYGHFDTRHAKTFHLLNECDLKSNIWSMEVVSSLEEFVPLQYWRSPASDAEFQIKLENAKRLEEFGLSVYKGNSNQPSTDLELHKLILSESNMPQTLRPALAMSSFGKSHPINDKLEWRLIDQNTQKPNLTSDNPIIFENHPKVVEDYRSCAIIPIGKTRTIIRINKELGHFHHNIVWQDMIQIYQAHRYVLSSDKEYLTNCIKEYRNRKYESKIDMLRRYVFDIYKNK
ncbi:hypothetical protein MATR_19540 [Marivirga tractuosa]|uniref:DUF4238 domain-containing protein n=1 Tax=Marivirga tractuosa (strain ATCC 23168 / DSM 4126 / NBRC 15989 / NCIMB 1408 / VKM B-1430 / H-43) TaxID=643867 RepID=E4TNG9_MARTH|nr:DUF4238 domain-containing protein [Marivirga tractuosa]ADR20426.1 hypothetical protein Ftrac_0420 [Marivirga tractuosa DSM 4126]BDD15129.1 hypothetical protein MATR_19540 [Marivirga tractuosa]